jgi:hypothetical protein
MPKFLVTYLGSEAGRPPASMTEDENGQFMSAWGQWATKHARKIVDGGAPVGRTKRIDAGGVSNAKNMIVGYTIIEAPSHEDAAAMFTDHPHVVMLNHPVEVMELPAIPGM